MKAGWNTYAYAQGSPVRLVDPSGLVGIIPNGAACNAVYLAECGAICSRVGKVVEACGVFSTWIADYSVCKCSDKITCPNYPGNDPKKAPEGTEWRGKPGSEPGSGDGNYYNPKTGESYRPDLDHTGHTGPHWDYKDPSGNWHRLYPGNRAVPK